jgi:tetratricopeptide (TPR) repeat protein
MLRCRPVRLSRNAAFLLSLLALAATTVTALAVEPPRPASQEEKAKAREHYQKGLTHYDLKEYAEALSEFKDAYRLVQDPAFLFNIAQCHRKLGQNVEALDFYRNFLRRSPNAPTRPEVERRIQEVERELAAHPPPPITERPPPPVEPPPPLVPPPPNLTPPPMPPPRATESAPTLVATPLPPPESQERPVYKRWWFWTAIALVAAGGAAAGVAYATRGQIGDCHDLPSDRCRTVP